MFVVGKEVGCANAGVCGIEVARKVARAAILIANILQGVEE
jgi:hypothetical protein